MDELLELMNDDIVGPTPTVALDDDDSPIKMADKAHDDPIPAAERSNNGERKERRNPKRPRVQPSDSDRPSSANPQHTSNPAEASVDDRLGIRMSNRLVSSSDLSELITDYPYFSPSVISAMTLKRLNALLVEPSPIISSATVAGKTDNLVTVGIVFSNSGTRISSKGGAFCVLTIGNLDAGPSLSVFLFGEAYGKYCVSLKQGRVIALMAPKLLPASRGDDKSNRGDKEYGVSFSVYDVGQLKIVATARDYGTCKATTSSRIKQSDGTYAVVTGKPCKHYVDKRQSHYCEYHRKKENSRGGGKQGMNRFQQVKAAHEMAAPIHAATTVRRSNLLGSSASKKANRFLNGAGNNPPEASGTNPGTTASTGNGAMSSVPKHMTREAPKRAPPQATTRNTGSTAVEKLKAKREARKADANDAAAAKSKSPADSGLTRSRGGSAGGDWMKEAKVNAKKRGPKHMGVRAGFSLAHFTKQRSSATPTGSDSGNVAKRTRKPTAINTVGMNFDGSVCVPTQSKLFQQSQTQPPKQTPERRIVTPTSDSKKCERVLQQQADIAQRLKESKSEKTATTAALPLRRTNPPKKAKKPVKNRKADSSEQVDDFLAAMGGNFDEEKVRTAKSRFANEVAADEYAKSRRKLVELEKQEASQQSRNKRTKDSNEKRLTKRWYCETCKQQFRDKPGRCIASNHRIREEKEIKETTSKSQKRNQLHKKSVEDGGLHLGSGIEWRDFGNRMAS